jgi:outer membrane protein TolC
MKKILFVLLVLVSPLIEAQEVISVTKNDVLVKVKENNNDIKILQQNVLMAKGDYNQTNAVLLPNISVSHTGIATNNPLMAFGSKLNQEILTQNDFNPDVLNDPSQIQNYSTKFEIKQPLINLDGIYQRKAAKAKLNATTLQSERTEDHITLEVEKAYMQLQLAYKSLEILETVKKSALENKRTANNSYKLGYLQKADVLAIEVRVTEIENQLQNAKSNIANASNYISVLMNDTTYNILRPTDELRIPLEAISRENLSENRSDIQAMQYAREAYKQLNKADKMSFLPRLNAFGSYQLYDNKIFQGSANGYLVGAQLSWDILQGTKRFGKSQKSKAEFEKSKIEYKQYVAQSQLELNKAQRMLQDAKNKLHLTELAMQQSKESLRIRTNRFKQGLEKTSDLLNSEAQYAQKQLEYYATIYQHNYALAYVQFLTIK